MTAQITAKVTRLIAQLDAKISQQLNCLLHHPTLQQLESAWRNLYLLTLEVPANARVKIKLLDASWLELKHDFDRTIEFDQTALFEKLYQAEFGMPGGEPHGVLITDYAVNINHYGPQPIMTDLAALAQLAQIAAAAFVPIILNVATASFGLSDIAKLEDLTDLSQFFKQFEFKEWLKFREMEEARFIGLTLPRFVLRTPYALSASHNTAFQFQEKIEGAEDMLWGNASFAFAATLVHAFMDNGWFTDIQGLGDAYTQGGLLHHLPKTYFAIDSAQLQLKQTAEIFITDALEYHLSEHGFIPHCQTHYSHLPIFYSARSVQLPKIYQQAHTTVNAQLSIMLPYLFCVCRFAHYIKVIARDKIGSFITAFDCEQYLNNWLLNYVAGNQTLSNPHRAKYPLQDASVSVKARPGMPGSFSCIIQLQPRIQMTQVESRFILTTELQQGVRYV